MTDYKDIHDATAETQKKAPEFADSVLGEAFWAIICSGQVYDFAEVIEAYRKDDIELKVPEGFPVKQEQLQYFKSHSVELTEINEDTKDGMSFKEINTLLAHNADQIEAKGLAYRFLMDGAKGWKDYMEKHSNDDSYEDNDYERGLRESTENTFLTYMRCLQGSKACVYSVLKDRTNKRVWVVFRGSTGNNLRNVLFAGTTRDWHTNLQFFPVQLPTPELVKDKMTGKLQERVLVHQGFRDYIWNNPNMAADQRGLEIWKDVKKTINGEEGYNVYITGHSLGGALATMFAFAFAGAGGEFLDEVPRPITCISVSAPYSGTNGYRMATERMERDGLLRSLRINLPGDIVPKGLPVSWFFRWPIRRFCHTGINLRLTKSGYRAEHTSRAGFFTAIRNGVLDIMFLLGLWNVGNWHNLNPETMERLGANHEELGKVTIADLYKDESVVSKKFINGNF